MLVQKLKISVALMLATLVTNIFGQDKVFYKHFAGNLNTNIAIRMSLVRDHNDVKGYYFYESVGIPISLEGKVNDLGRIEMEEAIDGNTTGYFEGEFNEDLSFSGVWMSPDKKRVFPFTLREDYKSSIAFDLETYSENILVFPAKDEPAYTILYSMLLPEILEEEEENNLRDSIKDLFFGDFAMSDSPAEAFNNFVEKARKEYQEYTSGSSPDEDLFMFNWSQTVHSNILVNDYSVLTYMVEMYDFQGGAHGNYGTFYYSFDLNNSKRIRLTDIFEGEYEAHLDTVLRNELLKLAIEKTGSMFSDLAQFGFYNNEVVPSGNFALCRSGIIFHYNPYEIAPYALGDWQVFVPFYKLEDYVKPIESLEEFIKKEKY